MAAARKKRTAKKAPDVKRAKGSDRDGSGKFRPGHSRPGPGNPNMKRVHALRAAVHEAVTEKDIKAVLAEMLRLAKGGKAIANSDQIAAARVLLERVIGKPQTPAIPIDVPPIKSAEDVPVAFAAVFEAARTGDLSVEQMAEQLRILDGARTAFGEAAMRRELDELREMIRATAR